MTKANSAELVRIARGINFMQKSGRGKKSMKISLINLQRANRW